MSIPLVQNNEKDSINTSIIAIKRNIERINMLLGLVDSGSPDLSGLATKQELQDAVTELQPVDEVTSGNMQSVTSNAVAEAIGYLVWENTNPQAIGAVTINFDRPIPSGYTKIRIEAGNVLPNYEYVFYTDFLIGKNGYLSLHFISAGGVIYMPNRIVSNITTNSFKISVCRFYKSDVGFSEVEDRIIPLRVWAIK